MFMFLFIHCILVGLSRADREETKVKLILKNPFYFIHVLCCLSCQMLTFYKMFVTILLEKRVLWSNYFFDPN